ncbi:hypothetical protein NUM3379_27960 [Kineococcus sp. NUM-3379]
MSATTTSRSVPGARRRSAVAAVLCGTAAALLLFKGVRTLGPGPHGTVEPGWAAVVLLGALLAAGAAAWSTGRPRRAVALAAAAAVLSLAGDALPTAPPRLLPLLPLAVALALLSVRPAPAGVPRARGAVVGWAGIVLHVVVGWPYLTSGLVAPGYGVALLWALWGALLVVAVRLLRRRPVWTPVVPAVALGAWFLVLSLGGHFLGWSP